MSTSFVLGSHFEQFIAAQLESGRYNNASEVVRAALRMLEESELKLQELRAALDEGFSSPESSDLSLEESRRRTRRLIKRTAGRQKREMA
jgi:antitoxin ParD1/3/4